MGACVVPPGPCGFVITLLNLTLPKVKAIRLLGLTLLGAVLLFVLFLVYASITYYDPPLELIVADSPTPDTIPVKVPLNALTWNIGYAGLGDDMDFFYDAGRKVRDTKERTMQNLDSIAGLLSRHRGTGFILLQEVDFDSHRSYHLREHEVLAKALGQHYAFALNYNVAFVPIPPRSPMGRVTSGVVSFSRYDADISTRYAYPGQFGWPNRLFNLRRCMLVSRYPTKNGREFILINTHKSAFDDGSLKAQEMQLLKEFALQEYGRGNYVVVGGDWNQSPPEFPLSTFGENYRVDFFKLTNVAPNYMPEGWQWAFDPGAPTNRYLNEPYTPGKTFRTILDFFLVSPNVQVLGCKTIDLNFRHSDHNPVTINFVLN